MILQGAGNDLRRRGRALVGENAHRDGVGDRRGLGRVILLRAVTPFHRGELLPLLEEHVVDVEACRENPAWISPKIDDDSARLLCLETLDSGLKVLCRILI